MTQKVRFYGAFRSIRSGSTPVSRSSVFSDLRPTYGVRLGRETRGPRALLPGYRDDTSAFQSKVAIRTPDSRDA